MKEIKCSIRQICEFIHRHGHIISEINLNNRALEGTKIHQEYQNKQPLTYLKEVPIDYEFDYQDVHYFLQGRIDGMMILEEGVCIDEIKSVTYPVEDLTFENVNQAHFYQLICYLYMYCKQNDLNTIDGQLVYIEVKTKQQKKLRKTFTLNELSELFFGLLKQFHQFVQIYNQGEKNKINSLQKLHFPYTSYRKGQQEMMNGVYYTIKQSQKLFIHASTGLGKTLGTIYPSLVAMEKGYTNKILYLTAKEITKTVAKETMELFFKQGLKLRMLNLNAKDKMCFLEERHCHPDYCPYAKNHYDRVNQALLEILQQETLFAKENIQEFALKHQACPFELSLDLFNFCDFILLDYNYAFDPIIFLQRAYEPQNKLVLLVDEAHNLVERARNMFSSELNLEMFKQAKGEIADKQSGLYKALLKIEDAFLLFKNDLLTQPYLVASFPPVELIKNLENFNFALQRFLVEHPDEELLLNLFFSIRHFLTIYELYGENYKTYVEGEEVTLKLFCNDPSELLQNYYKQAQAVIFFSATLLPITYFYRILGGQGNDLKLYYDSPFDSQNQLVLVANDVSTRYHERPYSYQKIVRYIHTLAKSKVGNYLVFFPSYAYLEAVYACIDFKDCLFYKQEMQMDLKAKEQFLELFKETKTCSQIFFGVLGGMFSEGIDFKGDQLIGAIIVGVGLPQLSLERDLIKDYFAKDGFDYAYRYPGMNKVLQAAGRVIRQEQDRGVILLLDDRYEQGDYKKMLPAGWKQIYRTNEQSVEAQLEKFWKLFNETS